MEGKHSKPEEAKADVVPIRTWRVHPARQRPGRAILGLAIIFITAYAIAGWVQDPSWQLPIGLGAAFILLLSVNRFFLPTTFKIDEDGITANYPLRSQRARWSEIRRFLVGRTGGLLSRRAKASSLDVMSGLQLLFDEHRDEHVAFIRSRLDLAGGVK